MCTKEYASGINAFLLIKKSYDERMDGIFMRRCDTKKVNLRKKNLKGDGGQGCSHASVE